MLGAWHTEAPPDRARARQLWLAGLDQQGRFAFDSAIVLYRGATQADTSFFPAFLDQLQATRLLGNPLWFREEIARRSDLSPAHRRCLISVARLADDDSPSWIEAFQAMLAEQGSGSCVMFGLAKSLQLHPITRRPPEAGELDAARVVVLAFPDHAEIVTQVVVALHRLKRPQESIGLAMSHGERGPHVLVRIRLRGQAARVLVTTGDTARARALLELNLADARRDGRGGVLHEALDLLQLLGTGREQYALEIRRVIARAPRALAIDAALSDVAPMVEAGRMNEALDIIQPHGAWAVQHDLVRLVMRLRQLEGRALVRSGRAREAIPVLEAALSAAGRLGSVQYVAEANHQLTHAYESLADWPRAVRASTRFVASAQATPDPGIRVSSYHDAATVRWKAGWHASADSMSRMMVAAIERERMHFAFAAQYYERVGDLGKAMAYLRRAAVPGPFGSVVDRNVLLAGLVRMHLALGNADSAMAAAAAHDSLRAVRDEVLVPRVLVARGEPARAVAAMRRWTGQQAALGNMRGQLSALVTLAEALERVAPAEAETVARDAEVLALASASVAERATAMRVRGVALWRMRSPEAVSVLSRARALSRTHPDALQRILSEIALGDALAATGRHRESLAAYGAAARLVERAGSTVADDVAHARFRAARTRAYDGAIAAVLAAAGPSVTGADVEEVLSLSARKKLPMGQGTANGAGVRAIQRRLARLEAMVDFVVVDTNVVATVVTSTAASLHSLQASSTEIAMLARRLVGPLTAVHSGRVDLARAPFDITAARRLHDVLVQPLAGRLTGIEHLVIVPDLQLHAVPFEALVTGGSMERPLYLIDRHSVRYAVAPVAHAKAPSSVTRLDRMLLVAGDAPGSASERDDLRRIWGNAAEVLAGARATEANLHRRAAGRAILHVATHARSDDRDPMASFLALTADSAGDGMLNYSEIEQQSGGHALVVLNACETSAGELLAGSGFMSLARAFLVSGSSSVVATQWPVGEVSAKISTHFYGEVRRDKALHVALRAAKLAVRTAPATSHPFYWASHQLLQRF